MADDSQGQQVDKLSIAEIIAIEQEKLLSLSSVVGVGEGVCNEQPCIKLFLSSPPDNSHLFPKVLGDYQVEWVVTGGEFKAR